MAIETTPWDAADYLDSNETILASLEAVFEVGGRELIVLALDNAARAEGLEHDARTAQSDIASVAAAVKAVGPEPTAKAA